MTTWGKGEDALPVRVRPAGAVLAVLRGSVLGAVTFGGLAVLLVLRLAERPLFGSARPISPRVTRAVCRTAFVILGIGYARHGRPMTGQGAVVANHSSWLDIFALNAGQSVYFVAKQEVARWPAIGWLARATGTVFIARDPKAARAQQDLFETRIRDGHRLLFFPEGTSTDGRRVLTFKPTLFAAFFSHGLEEVMRIQPVSIVYRAPPGRGESFYGWWGDMDFAGHLFMVLANLRQGSVEVTYHDPVAVDAFASRKALARHCEDVVRATVVGPPA